MTNNGSVYKKIESEKIFVLNLKSNLQSTKLSYQKLHDDDYISWNAVRSELSMI